MVLSSNSADCLLAMMEAMPVSIKLGLSDGCEDGEEVGYPECSIEGSVLRSDDYTEEGSVLP